MPALMNMLKMLKQARKGRKKREKSVIAELMVVEESGEGEGEGKEGGKGEAYYIDVFILSIKEPFYLFSYKGRRSRNVLDRTEALYK